MKSYHLIASTALDLVNGLSFLRTTNMESKRCWYLSSHRHSLDIIGRVEDNPGYHANLQCDSQLSTLIPGRFRISEGKVVSPRKWA